MKLPDCRELGLDEGVLVEPTPGNDRMALWVPGPTQGGVRQWERVSTAPRGEVMVEAGLCSAPATAVVVRQQVRGFFGKLSQRFRNEGSGQRWVLPNGEAGEQWGERQNGFVLVWNERKCAGLDEARVKARWPEARGTRRLGKNLVLVAGVAVAPALGPVTFPAGQTADTEPRAAAAGALAAARTAGDRQRELVALADLGIACLRDGEGARAVGLLEEALALALSRGDRLGEQDVLGNLASAVLAAGDPRRALELFEQALGLARESGDPFAEKIALGGLAFACWAVGERARAFQCLEQALELARAAGDRPHQVDLLWNLAVQHAELGEVDKAMARAQAAVDLLNKEGNPQAAWYAQHLTRYRGGYRASAGATAWPAGTVGGTLVASAWAAPPIPAAHEQPERGPGVLRMALSAGQAMARFLGSGCQRVTADVREQRLRACAGCVQHTGLRCRPCGCFTAVKSWAVHETCPLGKWPVHGG